MEGLFKGCSALTTITGLDSLDISRVNNISCLFYDCKALTDLSPVSDWDIRKIASLSGTFYNCSSLNSIILGNDFYFEGENITSTYNKALLPTPKKVL